MIPRLADVLNKDEGDYTKNEWFPFDDISTQARWNEVKNATGQVDEPWTKGWLQFKMSMRVEQRRELWVWRIDKGAQLGAVAKAFTARMEAKVEKGSSIDTSFRLEKVAGKCNAVLRTPAKSPVE